MSQPLRPSDLNPDSEGMTLEAFIHTTGEVELIPFYAGDGYQVGTVQGSWATTKHFDAVYPLLVACVKARHADYVGYWYEEATGLYHIDPSRHYSESRYNYAIEAGHRLEQISIWSWMQMAEVPVYQSEVTIERFKEMV